MPKTTLIIGSSTAAKSQAKALIKELSGPTLKFLPWWQAFRPGRTLLEELDAIYNRVDGALLLFSPESTSTIRGDDKQFINLNVLFEFGYFYGALGHDRVAVVKYGDYYLPTDLGGYIHITGSRFFKRSAVVSVGKRTKTEFTRWIEDL